MNNTTNLRYFRSVDSMLKYLNYRYGFKNALFIRNAGAVKFENGSVREFWTTKYTNGPIIFDQYFTVHHFKPRAI